MGLVVAMAASFLMAMLWEHIVRSSGYRPAEQETSEQIRARIRKRALWIFSVLFVLSLLIALFAR